MGLAEIAVACTFVDQSHFTRVLPRAKVKAPKGGSAAGSFSRYSPGRAGRRLEEHIDAAWEDAVTDATSRS